MDINQATQIFNAYTKFSADELGKVKGDLKKADAVARFQEGGEDHDVSVVAATDDKIHKFSRSPELKNSNRVAHEKFVDAVLTLLNKQSVNDLDPHLQQAFAEMSTPERPLSARRIHIIASEVKLALGAKGENAALNESVAKAGSGVRQTLIDFVNGKTNDVMPSVKDSLSAKLAAIKDELAPEDRAVVAGELAELENLVASATDVRKLVDDLQTARKNLAAKFNGRLGQREFAPGTHKCAVSFTLLNALPRVYSELKESAFLLDVKTVRENVASLLQDVKSEAERAYLTRIQDAVGEANIENLDQSEVNKLLFESAPVYVSVIRTQVKDIVDQAIKNEKELILDEYRNGFSEDERPVLMNDDRAQKLIDGKRSEIESDVWNQLAGRAVAEVSVDKIGELRKSYRDEQATFVDELHKSADDQLKSTIKKAIDAERERLGETFKAALLTQEEEDEFVADQMRIWGASAFKQVTKGEKVRLPITEIEDAFAARCSDKVKEQAVEFIEELDKAADKLHVDEKNKMSAEFDLSIKRMEGSADSSKSVQLNDLANRKSDLEKKTQELNQQIANLKENIRRDEDYVAKNSSGVVSRLNLFLRSVKSRLVTNRQLLTDLETQCKEVEKSLDEVKGGELNAHTLDEMMRTEIENAKSLEEDFEGFVRNEEQRLTKCKEQLLSTLRNTPTPDVALLEKLVNGYKTAREESLTAIKDYSKYVKSRLYENDVKYRGAKQPSSDRPVAKPEGFTVYGRYGLHDVGKFTVRAIRENQGFAIELVNEEAARAGLQGETAEAVKAAVEKSFENPELLPSGLKKGCEAVIKGQTNESIATTKIANRLELYIRTLVDAVKSGTLSLAAGGSLPEVSDEQMRAFKENTERIGGHVEQQDSTSVFGNHSKIETALSVLDRIGSEDAKRLAEEFKAFIPLFSGSVHQSVYASDDFDTKYFNAFMSKLANAYRGSDDTHREYLTMLLDGIGRARDVNNPRNVVTVLTNVKEFLQIAKPLAEAAETEATAAVKNELGPVKELLGLFGTKTLDRNRLVDAFCTATGVSAGDFAKLSASRLRAVRPYVEFICSLKNRDGSAVSPQAFEKFISSVIDDSMPWSLVDEQSDLILRDFVDFQRLLVAGDGDEPGRITGVVDGLGTMNAKDILVGLAKDGLLALPHRAFKENGEYPSTVQIVSFLYKLNANHFGGLNELCRQVFGCEIAEVDSKRFNAAVEVVKANMVAGNSLVEGLGAFAGLKQADFVKADAAIRKVRDLLTFGVRQLFDGKNSPKFTDLNNWIHALDNISEGVSQTISIAGSKVVVGMASGSMMTMTMIPPGMKSPVTIYVDNNAKALARNIREVVLGQVSRFTDPVDRKNIAAILIDAGKSGSRELAISALKGLVNADSVSLAKVPTAKLVETARGLIEGTIALKKFSLTDLIAAAPKDRIESEEVLDMIDRYNSAPVDMQNTVELLETNAKRPETARDFAAELVASSENWLTDRVEAREEKLRVVFKSNAALLERLSRLEGKALDEELAAVGDAKLAEAVKRAVAMYTAAGGKVENIAADALAELATSVDTACTEQMNALQDDFDTHFVGKLVSAGLEDSDLMSLGDMAGADTIDLSGGYGAFLKEMLSSYFKGMDPIDRRMMLAAVLRETSSESTMVERITALVKSAGPIFVKIMQGIPEKAVPVEYRKMMGIVKGSLPHIPETVVKAQMLDLVAASNGIVKGITVVKSIGAASVGEAFLCRVKTAENPDGEECVIKLLRPEVQNRAKREEAFIHRLPSGGKAFLNRLGSIFDELDLKKEAENVEASSVYDNVYPDDPDMMRVKTMRLHPILRPSAMSLVAKKAPGITVEKYFKKLNDRLDDILKSVKHVEKVGPGDKAFRNSETGDLVTYRVGSGIEMAIVKDRLHKLYKEALQRQSDLVYLSKKWVEAALFRPDGKPGFVHGDLHDANAMTSELGATFIDFGNAMQMTKEENAALVKALIFCVAGMKDKCLTLFKSEPFSLSFPDAGTVKGKKMMKDIDSAFKKGASNDSGFRFAALVSVFQKYDVAIPPVLYGFTQSMLRIQNAITSANEAINRIVGVYESLKFDDGVALYSNEFTPPGFEHGLRNPDPDNGFANVHADVLKFAYGLVRKETGDFEASAELYDVKLRRLCLDQEGRFSPELVKRNLLPIAERYRDVYAINVMTDELPAKDTRIGEVLYQLVKEFSETDLDLSGGPESPDAKVFDSFCMRISGLISNVHFAIVANAEEIRKIDHPSATLPKNLRPKDIRQPLHTFPQVFQSSVWQHLDQCIGSFDKFEKLALVPEKNNIENKLGNIEKENTQRLATEARNRRFLTENPLFPVDVARTVTNTSFAKFVFEDKAFDKKDLSRMAKIIKANVLRLKNELVDNANYDISKDAELWGGKKAVELAMNHWGSVNLIFDKMKTLDEEKKHEVTKLKQIVNADTASLTAEERELVCYAIDHLLATNPANLV